jgi:HSP20 family protein
MLSRYNVLNPMLPVWGIPSTTGGSLHTMMNRLFQDFETVMERPAARRVAGPRVQLRDAGDAISMLVDLPGYRREDIDLSVEGMTLSLKAAPQKEPAAPEGFNVLRRERVRAAVDWSFELPYPIDVAAVSATLEQGRLQVVLPKAEQAKPRSIPVKAA